MDHPMLDANRRSPIVALIVACVLSSTIMACGRSAPGQHSFPDLLHGTWDDVDGSETLRFYADGRFEDVGLSQGTWAFKAPDQLSLDYDPATSKNGHVEAHVSKVGDVLVLDINKTRLALRPRNSDHEQKRITGHLSSEMFLVNQGGGNLKASSYSVVFTTDDSKKYAVNFLADYKMTVKGVAVARGTSIDSNTTLECRGWVRPVSQLNEYRSAVNAPVTDRDLFELLECSSQ